MTVRISLEELIKSGAHFGHQSRRWNPKMEKYLHGVKDGVHIFDLIKTKKALEEALEVLEDFSKKGKSIVLVGTKKQVKERVKETANEAGISFVNERWLGGTLTNFEMISRSIKKLSDMKTAKEEGEYNKYTKKERLLIDREIDRLERFFGGIAGLSKEPDLLIIIDTKREAGAVKEASRTGVKTIAIVDSNCDPDLVDYPIPMNDDATKALNYVLDLIKEVILKAQKPKTKKK